MPINVEKSKNRPYFGGSLIIIILTKEIKGHYYNINHLSLTHVEK